MFDQRKDIIDEALVQVNYYLNTEADEHVYRAHDLIALVERAMAARKAEKERSQL